MKGGMQKNYFDHTDHFNYHAKSVVDMSKTTKFKLIKKYLPQKSKILDIGCGSGSWLLTFKNYGLNSVGIDISADRIKQCKLAGLNAYVGDITKELPFDKEMFDIAFVNHVFEHVDEPNRIKLIKSIYTLLKIEDVLIASTPYNQKLEETETICPKCKTIFNWDGHRASFGKGDLKSELESHGFKCVDEFITMPIPFGSKLPKWLIIFLCNQLLKRGYDVGVWEITTVARKV